MEIWKEIPGYSNYTISNFGIVKYKKDTICNIFIKFGYPRVYLTANKIRKSNALHRLLAITFIPNPENKPTVNHKDHNKENFSLDNLEWATHSEQNFHKRVGIRSGKIILQYDLKGNFITKFISISEASKKLKLNKSTLSKYCHSGLELNNFIFEFEEYEEIENEIWLELTISSGVKINLSNKGRIKNKKGIISYGSKTPGGYLITSKTNTDKKKLGFLIHRLVYLAFTKNMTEEKMKNKVINHIDGNKENNFIENLELVTQRENIMHSVEILGKTNRRKVSQICLKTGKVIQSFISIKEASDKTLLKECGIAKVCRKDKYCNTYRGYSWFWTEEIEGLSQNEIFNLIKK